MGIQKLREEFEKLSNIKRWLRFIKFSLALGEYIESDRSIPEYTLGFINGAWYAFQKQQKQINEIKAIAESWINQDYTHNSDSTDIKIQQMKDCGRDIIRKINGE